MDIEEFSISEEKENEQANKADEIDKRSS